ncbi:formylglycine-generating enzyme family protein [Haloarchaeobius sp. DFWS5]|uniref:formylglycine-generating enzyme family protein n=1 Tax=Haloarchaeobius sp. DFWS5 TaxID=3446114 RepID=UPI003EB90217
MRVENAPPGQPPAEGMNWVPGGRFTMGSNDHYPEEAPAHDVRVEGFWMDATPVTNAQFQTFVDETDYVTVAERDPDSADYPEADPELLVAGSAVFTPPSEPVPLQDPSQWWQYVPGACWRHPEGPESDITDRLDHPVVHVTFKDAQRYARWAGKRLPTEVQHERASRGGLDGATYAWGDEFTPDGNHMANTWQGLFPWENLAEDEYVGTSPVGSFPANGYGLYDTIGNVWEWTDDWFQPRHPDEATSPCCAPKNPRGGTKAGSVDPRDAAQVPRKVLKGGSHLCAPNYCRRYRPAARYPEPVDTSTNHVGFRCIVTGGGE